ncbi:MAG TPA: hypothetical protein VLA52_02865 [Thermohalobaculum sp.]|nr:hypothetical protein [Thermohalobaculum sp.]
MPDFARLEIAPVSAGRPTFTFRDPGQVILQLNLYGFPDPKGTSALVAPLIDAASSIAARHALALTGIEIVFHRRDGYNPMQVWAAKPPYSAEQTSLTPLGAELIESMRPPP